MSPTTLKRQRLEARVTERDKELVQRAANLTGCTVSDFIASSVRAAAEKAIRDQYVLELSVRDSAIFVEALLDPPEPSERMRAAAREYRESVERR